MKWKSAKWWGQFAIVLYVVTLLLQSQFVMVTAGGKSVNDSGIGQLLTERGADFKVTMLLIGLFIFLFATRNQNIITPVILAVLLMIELPRSAFWWSGVGAQIVKPIAQRLHTPRLSALAILAMIAIILLVIVWLSDSKSNGLFAFALAAQLPGAIFFIKRSEFDVGRLSEKGNFFFELQHSNWTGALPLSIVAILAIVFWNRG